MLGQEAARATEGGDTAGGVAPSKCGCLMQEDMINEVRQAAEVHRQVRQYMMKHVIKPGVKLIDMCEQLESYVRTLIDERGLEAGIAFPTGALRAAPICGDCPELSPACRPSFHWSVPLCRPLVSRAAPQGARWTTSLRTGRRTAATRRFSSTTT